MPRGWLQSVHEILKVSNAVAEQSQPQTQNCMRCKRQTACGETELLLTPREKPGQNQPHKYIRQNYWQARDLHGRVNRTQHPPAHKRWLQLYGAKKLVSRNSTPNVKFFPRFLPETRCLQQWTQLRIPAEAGHSGSNSIQRACLSNLLQHFVQEFIYFPSNKPSLSMSDQIANLFDFRIHFAQSTCSTHLSIL